MSDFSESKIPKGTSCFEDRKVCPYWSNHPAKPNKNCGYCAYLGIGDWQLTDEFKVLWKRIKLCKQNIT